MRKDYNYMYLHHSVKSNDIKCKYILKFLSIAEKGHFYDIFLNGLTRSCDVGNNKNVIRMTTFQL